MRLLIYLEWQSNRKCFRHSRKHASMWWAAQRWRSQLRPCQANLSKRNRPSSRKQPQAAPAAVQQQVELIAAQDAMSSQEKIGDLDSDMEKLTEGTDSEEDVINANNDGPPERKKKKPMSRAMRKSRAEATASGGAAGKIAKTKPAKK